MSKLSSLFCLLIAVSSSRADTMVINNASFSALPSGGLTYGANSGANAAGIYSVGAIPGWTETGSGTMGQWQPLSSEFNYLPDGSTIAYSNGGIISQQIGTVQQGMNYTLTVSIGTRADGLSSNDATAALLIDGVTYYASGIRASLGNWSTYTVTYTALQNDVGHAIAVELIEASSNGYQADFANVGVTDAVPEPSTGSFFGLWVVLCIAHRIRGAKMRASFRSASPTECAGA